MNVTGPGFPAHFSPRPQLKATRLWQPFPIHAQRVRNDVSSSLAPATLPNTENWDPCLRADQACGSEYLNGQVLQPVWSRKTGARGEQEQKIFLLTHEPRSSTRPISCKGIRPFRPRGREARRLGRRQWQDGPQPGNLGTDSHRFSRTKPRQPRFPQNRGVTRKDLTEPRQPRFPQNRGVTRKIPPVWPITQAVRAPCCPRKKRKTGIQDRDQNKDAPAAKRKNIVQQVPPLQALPLALAKVGESSGAATDPASSSPPVVPRSRLPDSRPEHLVPYLNELSKLVSKKDLEDFDGCTLGELVGAMQYSAFHLSCMTTYYKAKVGRYDRKMKEDIQSATTRADVAEKKAGELNELTKVKEDLQRQRAMYEAQLESLRDSHRAQVENLEREADNQYDQGLRHSYRCIMAVLGKQHPDLKMDDLAAGVAQHMDEEAAKEDAERVEPIVIEEENSPPRAVPADVGEASTPPNATGDTPPAPEEVQPTDAAGLTDPRSS
ncbi:hypothetical protein CUMW_107590 [Citrus unshiu]|uniref:Uncharacterized protein n=1 Tax=Citrus unshiu TaxID=55188 RepID=A0A2H5P658_CITUN|nr:hypothetical protein CUMW_107590 [Citrus unshiu]